MITEPHSKGSFVRWRPSELSEVRTFCGERKIDFSVIVRAATLFAVRQPGRFAELAAPYSLDAFTLERLRQAELRFEEALPAPPKRVKRAKRRKGR